MRGTVVLAVIRSIRDAAFSFFQPPMIQGITVIGDVMRPDGSGQPGGVDRATVWLFDAIKRQVKLASGLPIDVITANGMADLVTRLETLRPPSAAHRYWA